MSKFEVGKTYSARSICDYDCVFSWTVVKRTAKRMTLVDRHGSERVVGIAQRDGYESAKPNGSYSMCAIINSNDKPIAVAA